MFHSLRNKILFLSLFPVLLIVSLIVFFVRFEIGELGRNQVDSIRTEMVENKKKALENYIDIIVSSISPIYNSKDLSESEAKDMALEMIRSTSFGSKRDGYVFIYNRDGTLLASRASPEMEGKNVLHIKDPNGKMVVEELIEKANSGGGFFHYLWEKPSKNKAVEKLSYAKELRKWGWVVGTGFYIDDIEELIRYEKDRLDNTTYRTTIIIVAFGLGISAVAMAFLGFVISRLLKPVGIVANTLKNIGEGHGDLTKRIDANSQGEIKDICVGFNSFSEKLQIMIKEVGVIVQSLALANERLRASADGVNRAVESQYQETEQVATAVNEMSCAVQQVSASAVQAADSAGLADKSSQEGICVVENTISVVNGLSEGIHHTSDVIGQLNEHSSSIGEIVRVINDIAEQTNLLALNAAIEAARAGEQGRGFSVVADEVRTLANRTKTSTNEIQAMIAKLQAGAKDAVLAMENSRDNTESTVQKAGEVSESLQSITATVVSINDMNAQIACATEEQTAVAEEINRSVQNISLLTGHTKTEADHLVKLSEEVGELEKRLSFMVGEFKV